MDLRFAVEHAKQCETFKVHTQRTSYQVDLAWSFKKANSSFACADRRDQTVDLTVSGRSTCDRLTCVQACCCWAWIYPMAIDMNCNVGFSLGTVNWTACVSVFDIPFRHWVTLQIKGNPFVCSQMFSVSVNVGLWCLDVPKGQPEVRDGVQCRRSATKGVGPRISMRW